MKKNDTNSDEQQIKTTFTFKNKTFRDNFNPDMLKQKTVLTGGCIYLHRTLKIKRKSSGQKNFRNN